VPSNRSWPAFTQVLSAFSRGLGGGAIVLALCAPTSFFAQATGVPTTRQRSSVPVPFVGCASSGQTERLEAPEGTSKSVAISPIDAQALAYYEAADGIGLLAPRGWNCEGASGSDGSVLFLGPKPIRSTMAGWDGLEGTAIEIRHISSENSGMYEVAEVMARAFPEYIALAGRIWKGIDLPLPSGPYPRDTLKYKGKRIVEFKTPAQTEGLGNFDSWLNKSDAPISGSAILIVDPADPVHNPPSLVLLSVRLPPDLVRLAPTIIRYVERDVLGGSGR
jgi:hypothetical protein